jgi:hypothetical protein
MSNTKKQEKTRKPKTNNWNKNRQEVKKLLDQIPVGFLDPEEEEILYNENYHIKNSNHE